MEANLRLLVKTVAKDSLAVRGARIVPKAPGRNHNTADGSVTYR